LWCKRQQKVKDGKCLGEQQNKNNLLLEDFVSVCVSGSNRKLLISLIQSIFKLALVTCLIFSTVLGSIRLHTKKGELLEFFDGWQMKDRSWNATMDFLSLTIAESVKECLNTRECSLALQLHFVWLPLLLYSPWIASVSCGFVAVASNFIHVTPLDGVKTVTPFYWQLVSAETFIDGLLQGSFAFEITRTQSLLPSKVFMTMNIVYVGCIIATVLYYIVKDKRDTLKWKTWSKLLRQHQLQRENTLKLENARIEFLSSCSSGENMAMLRSFLHNPDFDPNQIDSESGVTGLHMACHNGHLSVVQAILDVKRKVINLNIENVEGQTPLMVVAAQGSKTILNRMLKEKKLKLKDTFGQRAICIAVEAEHWAIGLSIHEEMTKRGMLFKELSILTYLSRSVTLSNDIKKGLSKDKVSLAVYKRDILKWLSETPKEDIEEILSQERVLEELKEFLECSICFDNYGDSPILSCTNDHWICSICLPKNSCCPWCREQYSTAPPQRRRTSEKILKLLAMIKM
jgi:ankyrin repeat protein